MEEVIWVITVFRKEGDDSLICDYPLGEVNLSLIANIFEVKTERLFGFSFEIKKSIMKKFIQAVKCNIDFNFDEYCYFFECYKKEN